MENGVMMQYFEWYLDNKKYLWTTLKDDAKHLKDIGITAVWMPPAFKGIGGMDDVGYGVYDIYDLGEFYQQGTIRTKYGTKDEYLLAIQSLHHYGLYVYGDIVLNHKMGADGVEVVKAHEVNQINKNEMISPEETIVVPTLFTFPHRKNKYSDFIWNWKCFDGIDYDMKTKRHATFLFKDKNWDQEVDDENGNFDYLMGADIDFSYPPVLKELDRWGKWYLDMTHLDGFRLDAIKHISAHFYKNWIQKLREYSKKELFTVGEYWHGDVQHLLHYLKQVHHEISLFDVPLHYRFYEISHANGQFDLRTIFDNTLVQCDSAHAVTFVDNHDTQPSQGLQSWIEEWFKPLAYTLILLRKDGYPCVFYGDYYGIPYSHIPAKRDLLDQLLFLRKNYAIGHQYDYFDHPDIIGWVRNGHTSSALVCIMSDSTGGQKYMYVGKEYAQCFYVDVLNNIQQEVLIDENGYGCFICDGGSVSIYLDKGVYNG